MDPSSWPPPTLSPTHSPKKTARLRSEACLCSTEPTPASPAARLQAGACALSPIAPSVPQTAAARKTQRPASLRLRVDSTSHVLGQRLRVPNCPMSPPFPSWAVLTQLTRFLGVIPSEDSSRGGGARELPRPPAGPGPGSPEQVPGCHAARRRSHVRASGDVGGQRELGS